MNSKLSVRKIEKHEIQILDCGSPRNKCIKER